jgi:hypothetical protein
MDTESYEAGKASERLQGFARFFQTYMTTLSVVVAALPAPITKTGVILTPPWQTDMLAVFTPLICYLILSNVYFSRHVIAFELLGIEMRGGAEAPKGLAGTKTHHIQALRQQNHRWYLRPTLFSSISAITAIIYFTLISLSPAWWWTGVRPEPESSDLIVSGALNVLIFIVYIMIFASAVTSFSLMVLKEWLQDVMGLTDRALILGVYVDPEQAATELTGGNPTIQPPARRSEELPESGGDRGQGRTKLN